MGQICTRQRFELKNNLFGDKEMAIDLLIKNGTVITMDPERQVIEHCDVAIDEGKIIDIKPKITLQTEKTLDASGCAVNPGFINGHSHVYQSLIEGLGYDMHFNPWNWRFLFPVVSQITPEDAEASATLAALEMIRNGVTTISDHWYLHTDLENIYRVTDVLTKPVCARKWCLGSWMKLLRVLRAIVMK